MLTVTAVIWRWAGHLDRVMWMDTQSFCTERVENWLSKLSSSTKMRWHLTGCSQVNCTVLWFSLQAESCWTTTHPQDVQVRARKRFAAHISWPSVSCDSFLNPIVRSLCLPLFSFCPSFISLYHVPLIHSYLSICFVSCLYFLCSAFFSFFLNHVLFFLAPSEHPWVHCLLVPWLTS